MRYYSPIRIGQLEVIQKKVFALFPTEYLGISNLFYIPDNVRQFLQIAELKQELDRLEWTDQLQSIAFNITRGSSTSPIHIDTGTSTYSFNIPILNGERSFVVFYKTTVEPTYESYVACNEKVQTYYKYQPKDCIVVDKLEMTAPHVINVKEVHSVININPLPRITLLIRLKAEINLNHLFIDSNV
jgi:hypothetical protein